MRSAMCLTSVLLTVGCGSSGYDLVPVSGTITLDGKPVAGARVIFEPQRSGQEALSAGPGSDGITDQEGRYSLRTTADGHRGAVVGNHSVTLSTFQAEVDRSRDSSRVIRKEEIPARYFEPGSLSYDVPAEGTDNANFTLQTR